MITSVLMVGMFKMEKSYGEAMETPHRSGRQLEAWWTYRGNRIHNYQCTSQRHSLLSHTPTLKNQEKNISVLLYYGLTHLQHAIIDFCTKISRFKTW